MTLSCVCAHAAQLIDMTAAPARVPMMILRIAFPPLIGIVSLTGIVAPARGTSSSDLPRQPLGERRSSTLAPLGSHVDFDGIGFGAGDEFKTRLRAVACA